MRAVFREPVFQFLALGALLFAVYTLWGPEEAREQELIVIDERIVESLEAVFEATWKRSPTREERQGLIQDHLAEEILYREARKLGLGMNDIVIRRRLRQKMEFLLEESLADIAEEDLIAYFEENAERYAKERTYGFTQVFLGSDAEGGRREEWRSLVQRMNEGEPLSLETLAQLTLLPERVEASPAPAIDRVFGDGFAEELAELRRGEWSGPLPSAYGWHLVRLEHAGSGEPPEFGAVRSLVERDLRYERQQEAKAALIERLSRNYEIHLDVPPS